MSKQIPIVKSGSNITLSIHVNSKPARLVAEHLILGQRSDHINTDHEPSDQNVPMQCLPSKNIRCQFILHPESIICYLQICWINRFSKREHYRLRWIQIRQIFNFVYPWPYEELTTWNNYRKQEASVHRLKDQELYRSFVQRNLNHLS